MRGIAPGSVLALAAAALVLPVVARDKTNCLAKVVPGEGVEPSRLSAAGFKPAASAIPPPRRV